MNGLEEARYRASKGDNTEPDVITSWTMSVALRPSKDSLAAYNFETPNANLIVQVESLQAPGARTFEVYDYPGGYVKRPKGRTSSGAHRGAGSAARHRARCDERAARLPPGTRSI